MLIEIRSDHVMIDGYVNAVERDSKVLTDPNGEHFVEQIMSGAFQRAIDNATVIEMRANHRPDRVLGSTEDILELHEDAIGLRAHAETSDPEVVEAARERKLKGWSFGFRNAVSEREEIRADLYRRRISDLDLREVSIIYGDYTPCYMGTSVETRAEEDVHCTDVPEIRAVYIDNTVETPKEAPIDYTPYHERIEALERGKK